MLAFITNVLDFLLICYESINCQELCFYKQNECLNSDRYMSHSNIDVLLKVLRNCSCTLIVQCLYNMTYIVHSIIFSY